MNEAIITLDRANEGDLHRHYSITGVAPGRFIGVCCRRGLLPTGPSTQAQKGEWHLWWIKDPLIPSEYGTIAVQMIVDLLAKHQKGAS